MLVQGQLFDGESTKSGSDDGYCLEHMDGGMMKWKMKEVRMDLPGRNSVSKNVKTGNEMDSTRAGK